jgi:ATP-dependent DNA helicase DinG
VSDATGRDLPTVEEALTTAAAALGSEPRPGQLAMAEAVAESLSSGRSTPQHLLVQAGTGTGKSLAYLVPAALHSMRGDAVVVATATLALQRQLVERDLPVVASALEALLPRPLTYAVLKGRHNYVCLERLHRQEPEDDGDAIIPRSALGQQAAAVRAWALETETGDRDEFGESIDARVWRGISVSRRECVGEMRCAYGAECFTARRRDIAMSADIIVTNHAMLAIHAVEGIPVLPDHDAVIVDEAHELVDRVTQALAVELSARSVEQAATRARKFIRPSTADDLIGAAERLTEAARQEGRFREVPRDLLLALTSIRDVARVAVSEIPSDDDLETLAARQRARGALDEVFDTAGRLIAATSAEVTWVDSGTVKLAPLEVAGVLGSSLMGDRPVALTSATLTLGVDFEECAARLGVPGEWRGLDVGSPFDYAQQGILYVARHLPPPGRDGIPEEALDEVGDLIDAAGGRTLVLCSSWRAVERVGDYLRVRLTTPVLVQRRGEPAAALVTAFAADPETSLVGTMSLWQGVDVPGETCSLVVIDRIPFPRPDDPIVSARQEALGREGFREVSVPRAGLLLAQGAGRLIRDAGDRGVVAVLDPRLASASYGKTLLAAMPPLWLTDDREVVIAALGRLRGSWEEAAEA